MIHYFINSDPIPFFHSLMNKNVVPSSGRKPNNCTSKLTFFFKVLVIYCHSFDHFKFLRSLVNFYCVMFI